MTITVFYSCRPCGVIRRMIAVPAREAGEDVKAWLDQTASLIAREHRAMCPACHETTLSEIGIPTDGRSRIGGPAES